MHIDRPSRPGFQSPVLSRCTAAVATFILAAACVAQNPTGALAGREIVLSPGHGFYWHSTLGWTTQRGVIDGLIEDIHTHEIIHDHVLPYLEDSGAHVLLCRARSRTTEEHIIQNDAGAPAYTETGTWTTSASLGFGGTTYRFTNTNPSGGATATFATTIMAQDYYPVYVAFRSGANRTTSARVEVTHAAGTSFRTVDQTRFDRRWVYVGTYPFRAMSAASVTINNLSSIGGVIIADAVKIGDGFGTVVRGSGTSNQLKWKECSRYHAQLWGAPSSVYDSITSGQDNDDDVTCRPKFGEWYFDNQGDLYLSLHTNAGGGTGTDSFIHNTAPTPGSTTWQQVLHPRLINDLRAGWNAGWVDRGQKTANFGEVRELVQMPGVLVELAFHDDLGGDIEAIHHPTFRRVAGRALGRAILEYLAPGSPLLLDPPTSIAVRNNSLGGLVVTWNLVPGASGYRIRTSTDGGFAFDAGTVVNGTSLTIPDLPHSATRFFRIAAVNSSGTGPDSEPVGARVAPGSASRLLLVNGFDRRDRTVKEAQNPFHWLTVDGAAVEAILAAGYPFDGATNEAVANLLAPLPLYACVGWILGEESTVHESFSAVEQSRISSYLSGGGRFFFSGSEVGWDLDQQGSTTDRSFYETTLGQNYVADDANTYALQATTTGPLASLPAMTFDNGLAGIYDVDFPDVIQPTAGSGGQIVMRYSTGTGAAVLSGNGRVLGLGFPLEAIVSPAHRSLLMERILGLLGSLPVDPVGTPILGQPFAFDLDFPARPNQTYLAAISLASNPGLALGDGRKVPLQVDDLFLLSLAAPAPLFSMFSGTLDALGRAQCQIVLPNEPLLSGFSFQASAVTLNSIPLITEIAPWVRVTIP